MFKKELIERLEEWRNVARIELANLWKKEDEQAYQQLLKLIEQSEPEVDEKWIEEKARGLFDNWLCNTPPIEKVYIPFIKKFIRSLVAEIGQKRPSVDMEFVEKWASSISKAEEGFPTHRLKVIQMLKEVGVEVKDK